MRNFTKSWNVQIFHLYVMYLPISGGIIALKGFREREAQAKLPLAPIKTHFENVNHILYVSLDDIFFSANSLSDMADIFIKEGGTYTFLDEVHHYKDSGSRNKEYL